MSNVQVSMIRVSNLQWRAIAHSYLVQSNVEPALVLV